MKEDNYLKTPLDNRVNKSVYLERMVDNVTASYKIYWFKGIFEEIMHGNHEICFNVIIAHMISYAWSPIIYYHLNLGYNDYLTNIINSIYQNYNLPKDSSEKDIFNFILKCNDDNLFKQLNLLTKYVPTRLIRPFYEKQIQCYKGAHSLSQHTIGYLVKNLNSIDNDDVLYKLNWRQKSLTVSEQWYLYLSDNASIINGWINDKLVWYLQKHNPNVPAIRNKLISPEMNERNLSKAKKYWNFVMKNILVRDIYTQNIFDSTNLNIYGGLSIDHFVPWSFVLHNEMWNLCPTFQKINSSKLDKLPNLNLYLDGFCDLQYQAFIIMKKSGLMPTVLEDYLTLKSDIFQITNTDNGRDEFEKILQNTIKPLYQIALNQGYNIWSCNY